MWECNSSALPFKAPMPGVRPQVRGSYTGLLRVDKILNSEYVKAFSINKPEAFERTKTNARRVLHVLRGLVGVGRSGVIVRRG